MTILISKETQRDEKGCKTMAAYMLRTYDTYLQDVRNDYIGKYVDDETAIRAAKGMLYLSIHPLDSCEIQVYRNGMGCGEWCMFAAVYYDDDSIVVDDCYC